MAAPSFYYSPERLANVEPTLFAGYVPKCLEYRAKYVVVLQRGNFLPTRKFWADLEQRCRREKELLPRKGERCPFNIRKYKPKPLKVLPSLQEIEGEAMTLSFEVPWDISDRFYSVDEYELYSYQKGIVDLRHHERLPMQDPPVLPLLSVPDRLIRLPQEEELTFE